MNSLQDVTDRLEKVIQTGATDKDGKHPISAEFVLEELKSIADRPSGEWVRDGHHIKCNLCGTYFCDTDREGDPYPQDFCPHCGARMKGADDE